MNLKGQQTNVFSIKADSDSCQLQYLRHPGNENLSYFSFDKNCNDGNLMVYEITKFNENYRCWFIGNNVSSNHNFYITIPVDPLFFALYFLRKDCREKSKPLDQLDEDESPATIELLLKIKSNKLTQIADEKMLSSDLKVYKYNHDKAIKWLIMKTKYLEYLMRKFELNEFENKIEISSSSYNLSDSSIYDDGQNLLVAYDLIGHYIKSDLHDELRLALNLDNKRKLSPMNNLMSKKTKLNDDDAKSDDKTLVVKSKEKKLTTRQKSLAKAAGGTKGIQSFFKSKA